MPTGQQAKRPEAGRHIHVIFSFTKRQTETQTKTETATMGAAERGSHMSLSLTTSDLISSRLLVLSFDSSLERLVTVYVESHILALVAAFQRVLVTGVATPVRKQCTPRSTWHADPLDFLSTCPLADHAKLPPWRPFQAHAHTARW